MSGYIAYDAVLAHNDDLLREAARQRRSRKGSASKSGRRARVRNLPGSLVRGTRVA